MPLRGGHAIIRDIPGDALARLLLSKPSRRLRKPVGPVCFAQIRLAGHEGLITPGISHDDHGVTGFVLVDVILVQSYGFRPLKGEQPLVEQPPGAGLISIGIRTGRGAGQALRPFQEGGLAIHYVGSCGTVLLVFSHSVVVAADFENRGVNARVSSVLPVLGGGEGLEVPGDGIAHDVVRGTLLPGDGRRA